MAVTQLADVVIPAEFTAYTIQNSVVSSAFSQSGVMVQNGEIASQLNAGANQFTAPYWNDLPDVEADITSDDPTVMATPQKFTSGRQVIRKSYLHESWSQMSLAAELSGDDALTRLQNRVTNYWDRQAQSRLVASLHGIINSNVLNNASDMVVDVTALTGTAANISASSVIDTALTLGDKLEDVTGIAMHSFVYGQLSKADLIEFIPNSQGVPFKTFRGMAVVIDDGLAFSGGIYMTALFGRGAVGYAVSEPRIAPGTEVYNVPAAGNGGGQVTLHSRINIAIAPLGWSWSDSSGGTALVGESPTQADLAVAAHWTRVTARKACPIAFLMSK
jgi:hypothetical protein